LYNATEKNVAEHSEDILVRNDYPHKRYIFLSSTVRVTAKYLHRPGRRLHSS
jgi:hypothetical protein